MLRKKTSKHFKKKIYTYMWRKSGEGFWVNQFLKNVSLPAKSEP